MTERHGSILAGLLSLILLMVCHVCAAAEEIDFERFLRNEKIVVIQSQKYVEHGEYDNALQLLELGTAKYPERDDLFQLKGEALYKTNRLEEAEEMLRQALRLNPMNAVAKQYIDEIRTTEQAQVSTEWQEWMTVFRDKVGDFIVTFLAFGLAFLMGSLIEPVKLKMRLRSTRKLLEQGSNDEFLDMCEALLDEEMFAPLRTLLKFLLRHEGLEDAKRIMTKHVNTPERLPTLLRILERENEKLEETE